MINPSALVRGASREVSCVIATVTEDEREGFVLWEFSICGRLEFSLARLSGDDVVFFLKGECFCFEGSACLNDFDSEKLRLCGSGNLWELKLCDSVNYRLCVTC